MRNGALDTSDITLIRTVATLGSITRASEALFMSQPTLSKKLARLESRLNARLFHRSPTGLIPTEVADFIVGSAPPIEAQLKRIERHVEQLTQLETGEVRLGVGPIVEQVLLPDVLTRFVEATGNVQLSVLTDHADTLLAQLRAAELDVIAGPVRAGDSPDLTGFPLIRDALVTVARAGHPLFEAGTSLGVDDFPLAAPLPQGALGDSAARAGAAKQIISDNYPLLKRLTLASDCVTRGPWSLFREELESGALREVKSRKVVWQSACLVRPESAETPLVKRLVELLVDGSRHYPRR